MRVKASISLLTALLLFACASGVENQVGQEQNDLALNTVPVSSTETVTTSKRTTTTTEPARMSVSAENKGEHEFGSGGLVADLESWSKRELPLFITASHVDVSDIERISMFRSNAGHDYSDSFESCCSMKHYYRPFDYYEKRFTQPIFSPVDGVILYIGVDEDSGEGSWLRAYREATGKQPPDDYIDTKVFIRPDEAPNLWVRLHHVSPRQEILAAVTTSSGIDQMFGTATPAIPGFKVKAGEQIGVGLAEISIERHLTGNGVPSPCTSVDTENQWGQLPGCKAERQFHSIFEFMTDDVFNSYLEVADVERNDFIISSSERSAAPLRCNGEDFETRDTGAYLELQKSENEIPIASISEPPLSVEPLPSLESLAGQQQIVASFAGKGSSLSQQFESPSSYGVVVASDGGPIAIELDTGEGLRMIYNRPHGDGIATYESETFVASEASFVIQAAPSVAWKLLILTR